MLYRSSGGAEMRTNILSTAAAVFLFAIKFGCVVDRATATTLPQVAAIGTIASVGEHIVCDDCVTKALVKGARRLKRVFWHPKPKATPVDCLTTQPAGTPCPMTKEKK
jgi:hypothetical protein